MFKDVSDLFAWYNSLVKNVEIDASVYKSKVEELTADAASDKEKAKNIFYWIQDNIRYIAFEDGIAGFKPDSPQNVFSKRYGDCKGMAILTKYMLESAGLKSNLVWIGTDRLGYDYSTPSLSVDNHMICAVDLDGETIFLDGTEKYNKLGDYASRIQNKQALIENGDTYKIITVPENTDTNNDMTRYSLSLEGEKMTGTVVRSYSGESRVQFQNGFTNLGSGKLEDLLSDYLVSGNKNIALTYLNPFNVESRDQDLLLDYGVEISNAVSEFDDTFYIDIDPVKQVNKYLFKDRDVDYKFRMKESINTEISLNIPSGFAIGELPESLEISNDLIDIFVVYKQEGDAITYLKSILFKNRNIKKEQFELWNDSFTQLKDNLNKQITLIKQ